MINQPETGDKVLALLREYGWELGLQKLRDEIAATADAGHRNNLRFFASWMAAERGAHDDARSLLADSDDKPTAQDWSRFVQAVLAMRERRFEESDRLLSSIRPDVGNLLLRAAVAHIRGANHFHASNLAAALHELREALRLLGKDHFGTSRILDRFGMVYAARDNFHAAEEFFRQAIVRKRGWDDQAGLAVSFGNLGRLYLDWGYLDKAQECFLEDLRIAQNLHDERGEALMQNDLGRLALERGQHARAAARPSEAHEQWVDAAGWLDACIRSSAGRWTISEGYARKDRALLHLAEEQLDQAVAAVRKAEELFRQVQFMEGLAHVNRTWGMILRQQECFVEAKQNLRAALDQFTRSREQPEQARTQWEIARLSRAAGEPRPLVTREYLAALDLAESCRRAHLVHAIGQELKGANPEAYSSRVFRRVRGRGMPEDTDSLISGTIEPLSVLFLDLKGSTSYALDTPPEVVMMTLNEMMANVVAALREHDALVCGFRGDGFMAIFRGQQHPSRAVSAALDLCGLVDGYNEPRVILGLRPFEIRVGVSTGEAVLGNMGTYDLMDYSAIGTTVNLGARLESLAEPGVPCISRRTYDEVRGRFRYREGSPRPVLPRGLEDLGEQQAWDVVAKAP
jgi:class 3 adenylate cyclase/tetratricopeptide (TPR) repeat protein